MRLKIRFATTDDIIAQSNGQVLSPDTLNFKTANKIPVKDGLLCQSIFGPVKDYSCGCGSIVTDIRFKGKVCPECKVTILPASSRSKRMGHIELPQPILSPLAIGSSQISSLIGGLLGINFKSLNSILEGQAFLTYELNEEGILAIQGTDGAIVRVMPLVTKEMPPEVKLPYATSSLALEALTDKIDLLETFHITKQSDNRYQILKRFIDEDFHPRKLFIMAVPVSPASYRPVTELGSFFATNSINELLGRVVRRANRVRKIYQIIQDNGVPEILGEELAVEYQTSDITVIIELENVLLQKAVNHLMMGGSSDTNGKPLPGIISGIDGKTGRIRGNLLGKRVDYSGRSVITSGPELQIYEIGIPREMAYKVYKPFIIGFLIKEVCFTHKEAARMYIGSGDVRSKDLYHRAHPSAQRALEEIIKDRRILINRAPSLHRLNVMSFRPILINERCIKMHPMVCSCFNADFDGDTVAIHAILSDEAMVESDKLMSPVQNHLSPMNGEPIIAPSHEIILGLAILSRIVPTTRPRPLPEKSVDNLEMLVDRGLLGIGEEILFKRPNEDWERTCTGRLLIEQVMGCRITSELTKKEIKDLISKQWDVYGKFEYSHRLDKLMLLSLKYVTKSGISLCSSDFKSPSTREKLYEAGAEFEKHQTKLLKSGQLSEEAEFENVVRNWFRIIKQLQDDFIEEAGEDNPIVLMWRTGSRVSMLQVSQLVIGKGMISDAAGRITKHPIESSLADGLPQYDYYKSCSGSRKSLADKKNVTPISGYLARKLVNCSRDLHIITHDCGTSDGIILERNSALGRYDTNNNLLTSKGEGTIKVRSPVTCKAKGGICRICYGSDPTKRELVEINTPIGVIASQSLSEPATQLSMRTFHTSGAATLSESPYSIRSNFDGVAKITVKKTLTTIEINEYCYFVESDKCVILVKDGEHVKINDVIGVYDRDEVLNEDIAGTLPLLQGYFEISLGKYEMALVAKESGKVEIDPFDDGFEIYINGHLQGKCSTIPIFVANGEYVEKGTNLTYGEVPFGSIYKDTLDLELAAEVFVRRVRQIYAKEGIKPMTVHVETIFRAMSEVVVREDGSFGLRRLHEGTPTINSITAVSKVYPSWLKSLGVGWIKSRLIKAASNFEETLGLPTETIMLGGRLPSPLCQPKLHKKE